MEPISDFDDVNNDGIADSNTRINCKENEEYIYNDSDSHDSHNNKLFKNDKFHKNSKLDVRPEFENNLENEKDDKSNTVQNIILFTIIVATIYLIIKFIIL